MSIELFAFEEVCELNRLINRALFTGGEECDWCSVDDGYYCATAGFRLVFSVAFFDCKSFIKDKVMCSSTNNVQKIVLHESTIASGRAQL